MVANAYAVVDPWAVVVKSFDALVASSTVSGSGSPYDFAVGTYLYRVNKVNELNKVNLSWFLDKSWVFEGCNCPTGKHCKLNKHAHFSKDEVVYDWEYH